MSRLAYYINENYYNNLHYLWCTPYFDSDPREPDFTVPASSSPWEIYKTFRNEIDGTDLHGAKIELNRMGIRKGADKMADLGRISDEQRREIHALTQEARDRQFRPLLCVIGRLQAEPYLRRASLEERASPFSHEYIVEDLPKSAFDAIRIL